MTQTTAQTADYQLVQQTINHYLTGMTTHDATLFTKAFHADATMKWIEKGYEEVNAVEALSEHVNSNKPVKTQTSITSISVAGDAASVQLELKYETFSFIDFMQLLKIDGQWKIVSKTYATLPADKS